MIPHVIQIQVCGGRLCPTLETACQEYLECLRNGVDREKLHFTIALPDGEVKAITIRQEHDRVVAYGDFEGLPNFLEYADEISR